MKIDKATSLILDKVEGILSDRFVHYTVVATDGDDVYNICDSKIVAKGMIDYLSCEIEKDWKRDD